MTTVAGAISEAAQQLISAQRDRLPCPPVRALFPTAEIETAYAVQELVVRHRIDEGRRIVGRKIGLTSPAVQRQLGVDQPDFGFLFDDMDVSDHSVVALDQLLQPRIEAEIAFVLGRDLDLAAPTPQDARRAVSSVIPAFEIVDSRVAGWDITILDTVADNASSGLYVLGSPAAPLGERELSTIHMELFDEAGTVLSSGSGTDCLGDPINALVWLARTARYFGAPLRSGDLVLSGALGPMIPVVAGTTYTAELSGVGRVRTTFDITAAA